jgi:hypothetical protein
MDVCMGIFGVDAVATVMRAATATVRIVPCRKPFWWVSVIDSCERCL